MRGEEGGTCHGCDEGQVIPPWMPIDRHQFLVLPCREVREEVREERGLSHVVCTLGVIVIIGMSVPHVRGKMFNVQVTDLLLGIRR